MASRRQERTLARRQAIQVLYQSEILDADPAELLENSTSFIDAAQPSAYAAMLITGTMEHCADIDDRIEASSENWALSRMPAVDRSILRLACFEMLYVDEVPVSVAINEAVDLARDFGGEDESPKFVNGVLGRIASEMEDAPCEGIAEEPADAEDEFDDAAGQAEESGAVSASVER